MNTIILNNVSFSYDNQTIFKNFNLSLSSYNTYSIMGACGSGKSTLAKIIAGIIPYEGEVLINNKLSSDKITLVNEEVNVNNINELEIASLLIYFDVEDLKNKELSKKDKMVIAIMNALSLKREVLILDNIFNYLDSSFKKKLIKYLKDKKITLINIVSNEEDTLYTDYLVVLYDKGIAIEGPTLAVFKEEKLIRRLGFNLPFYVDLSIQLELYGLLDDIYLNKEAMVKNIWK